MVDPETSSLLKEYLHEGEALYWADKPRAIPLKIYLFLAFILLFLGGFFLIPIGYALVIGDMSIFDTYPLTINGVRVTSDMSENYLRTPFISLLLMMLAFVLLGIFWIRAITVEKYGVTDQRIIIVKRFPFKKIISVNPRQVFRIERSGNARIGTLTFYGEKREFFDKILELYGVSVSVITKIKNPTAVEALFQNLFFDIQQAKVTQPHEQTYPSI